jgi:diguanylate cyclase (GGDEF)-like protein
MVALPETHMDQGIVYAERLRAAVDQYGQETQKVYPDIEPISISVGATILQRDDDDIEQLIKRCDHALYAAKDRGRNRVCVD